jgi:hypothetical protein
MFPDKSFTKHPIALCKSCRGYFTLHLSYLAKILSNSFFKKTTVKPALIGHSCPILCSRPRVSVRRRARVLARRHTASDLPRRLPPRPQCLRTGHHHRASSLPGPPRSPWSAAVPCVEPSRPPLPLHMPPPGFPVPRAALPPGPRCHNSALSMKGGRRPPAIKGARPFLLRACRVEMAE